MFKCLLTLCIPPPTVPPPNVTINSTPITTSYYAGTPLNLTCTVQLIPQMDTPVTISWFKGPSNITIDNYTTISPLSITSSSSYVTTLMFNPLGTADSGWYYCNVSVQPGPPYIISGVGGGSLSLQVLGQWYQYTPFILTISAPSSSIRSSCSKCHHHSFPPSTLSWCSVLTNMSGHGGSWSGLTCWSDLDQGRWLVPGDQQHTHPRSTGDG